jgi:16S rRNA (adenine1518-N6/adenine1519-N6)-dimethyltransferase
MTSIPVAVAPQVLLRQAGLRAKKSWGQNFLQDASVLADIATACRAAPGRQLVELGAGLGALTAHLLAAGADVLAIERDREIAPLLRQSLGADARLQVREADAGRLDYAALAAELHGPLHVVGNLPYQISSRILVNLAAAGQSVQSAVVMVQREVAQRLVAGPPGRDYGLLSVLVQRRFTATILREVPPGAFHPPPKVHSAIVRLVGVPAVYPEADDVAVVATARAAFCARRKTLRNALLRAPQLPGLDAVAAVAALQAADIDPGARAETLDLQAFRRLAASLRAGGHFVATAPAADADEVL